MLLAVLGSFSMALAAPDYDPEKTGIVPACNPYALPNETNACGVSAAEQLVQNIIKFLFWIVVPIAGIMIAFGGFTIMTAAGSPEKAKKGTGMITIALTGIAIMGVSYLVIQFIFSVLDLNATVDPNTPSNVVNFK